MTTNTKSRPITLTLSDNHLRIMVESHLLKSDEIDDMLLTVADHGSSFQSTIRPSVELISRQISTTSLGIPMT